MLKLKYNLGPTVLQSPLVNIIDLFKTNKTHLQYIYNYDKLY